MDNSTLSIPPEIASSIVKVMAGVKKLTKGDRNTFDSYDFTSIDNFLEAVNPLCAEAGLFFLINEEAAEILPSDSGKMPKLHVAYDIMVCHESGTAMNGIKRNVQVNANGAQAFGAAQSYVLKQFMRSLFQIPTGDKDDPDFQQAEALSKRKSASKTKAARALYTELQQDIDTAENMDALQAFHAARLKEIQSLPDDWRQQLKQSYLEKNQSLLAHSEGMENGHNIEQ